MDFSKFIGLPVAVAQKELEKAGYSVNVVKNSLPKISTDAELVVSAKMLGEKQVLLIVGDFLINVEGKDGLV